MGLGDKSGSASDGGLWERAGSNTVLYCGNFVGWGRAPAGRRLTHLITSRVGKKRIMHVRQFYPHEAFYDRLQSAIELSVFSWNLFQVLRA